MQSVQSEAKSRKTPVIRLGELALHDDSEVRGAVAQNRACPEDLLVSLAGDADWGVRYSVALNPKTPATALELLAGDSANGVRQHVATHKNAPVAVLQQLANDPTVYVRESVAQHDRCPDSLLKQLAADSESRVRTAASAARSAKAKSPEAKEAAENKVDVHLPGHLSANLAREVHSALTVFVEEVKEARGDIERLETAVETLVLELNDIDRQEQFIDTIERESLSELIAATLGDVAGVDAETAEEWIDDSRDW